MENLVATGKQIIVNKNARSTAILIFTVIVVFMLNALLPIIEGSAHYTEGASEMTYERYTDLRKYNKNYQLTWASEQSINVYRLKYMAQHPDIPIEESVLIEPPGEYKVQVYTQFFFTSLAWYLTTAVHIISTILVYYSVFNYLLTRRKQSDVKYVELLDEVDTLTNNHLDPITFEPWMVNEFNHNRKITQHRTNVKYEIDTLNKKTDYRIRMLAKREPENPECIEYVTKKTELEYYMTDEYISEYIDDIEVKGFVYIHPMFVMCGYNILGRSTDSYSLLRSDTARIGKDSVNKLIINVTLTVMLAILMTVTVVSSLDRPWYWMLFNIVVTVTPLVIQIPLAYDYCDTFMDTQLITNLTSRRTIAFLYLAYMKGAANAEQSTSVN